MSTTVLCDVSQGVALLTLNRPEKLNAINYEMADALVGWLDRLEPDPAVRVVVITGAGDRAFSAGGDIPEFFESIERGPDAGVRDFVRRGQDMTARIESFPKPVVAAVNGLAYGGGCEITEAAHLAVADEAAQFAKPEIAIGIPPTFGGTQRLPRLAGRKRALQHLLTGDPFPATTALELGLVNQLVPPGGAVDGARHLADRIMRHSPLAAARIITAVTRGLNTTIDEGLRIEREQFARMAATDDVREGLHAWIEDRRPVYPGR